MLVCPVQVQEVGDGNINFVYIVQGPAGALVLKQGLPYIRIAPDWPLTQVAPHVVQAAAIPYVAASLSPPVRLGCPRIAASERFECF